MAIGGGHGLAASLRAARLYASTVTAVVSVADDGGSSGRLRAALRNPRARRPPPVPRRAGRGPRRPLGPNLRGPPLIRENSTDMPSATWLSPDWRLARAHSRRHWPTRPPSGSRGWGSAGNRLAGRPEGHRRRRLEGQLAVDPEGPDQPGDPGPPDPPANVEAAAAIADADQVVLGPGSLYTSLLAALSVPGIRNAVAARCGKNHLRGTTGTPRSGDNQLHGRLSGRLASPR